MYQIKNFCNVYPILKNKSFLLFGVSGAGKSYLMNQYFNSLLIDGFNVFVVNFSGLYKDYPIYLNSDYSHIFNSSLKPLISLPDNINSFCLHARCGFSDSDHYNDISNLIFSDLLPAFEAKRSFPSKPITILLDGCDSSMQFLDKFFSFSSLSNYSIVSSWIDGLGSPVCSAFLNASEMQIFCGSYHDIYNKFLYRLADKIRQDIILKFTSKRDYLLLNDNTHFRIPL